MGLSHFQTICTTHGELLVTTSAASSPTYRYVRCGRQPEHARKQGNMQQRAPLRPLTLRGLLRGERVAQRAGAVEHQRARRGVGVHAKEAQALQLEAGRRRIGLGLGVTAHTQQRARAAWRVQHTGAVHAGHQGSRTRRACALGAELSVLGWWISAGACAVWHSQPHTCHLCFHATLSKPVHRHALLLSGDFATQGHGLRGCPQSRRL